MTAKHTPEALREVVHETAIDGQLRALKMPGALREYRALVRQARATGAAHLEFLETVLSVELENRRQNQIAQRLRDGHFPFPRDLESFDFVAAPSVPKAQVLDLAQGRFVRERENVLLIGASGTGKTHLGIALCRAAIHEGYRSRFATAAGLMNDLEAAQAKHDLSRYVRTFARYDLVMVDEMGFCPFSADGARLLFQFFSELHERRAFILTSNLEFSRWTEVFGDPTLTSALLDRLTYRAHVIALDGESFRLREARTRRTHPGTTA